MKLSTSSVQYRQLPVERACRRISQLGFEAIDVWARFDWGGLCRHLEEVLEEIGAERFAETLAENKLKLCAATVYQDKYERYAEMLGKLGGCTVVRSSERTSPGRDLIPRTKRFIESLKESLELAEKYNSYIAVENHGNALLDSLDSLKAFVELNRHPRLGIALAPFHLQRRNESVERAIEICGDQLLFVYGWQDAEGTAQLPGLGPADCRPWLKALARINYRGYVNPFMHHEPAPDAMSQALEESRKYLLDCCRSSS
jgi:sugar phosphate isomerase/epimerase